MEHEFHTNYDRDYVIFACCYNCGIEIRSPHDLHMIDECPPVEMFTEEWYKLLEIAPNCDLQIVQEIHDS